MNSPQRWVPGRGTVARLRRGVHELLWKERRCFACSSVFSSVRSGASVLENPSLTAKDPASGLPEEAERHFCPECLAHLRMRRQGYCPRCGELAAWEEQPPAPCVSCLEKRPPWVDTVFWGVHEELLRELLLRLKFQKELPLAHALGSMLAMHPRLQALEVDMVVPIPLYRASLSQRGFNQSLELARPIAGLLRLPLDAASLIKTRATDPQHTLPRKDRRKNVRQAFEARQKAIRNKSILLVDDIMTTGATMRAAASALLDAGAENIHVAVISRTAAIL